MYLINNALIIKNLWLTLNTEITIGSEFLSLKNVDNKKDEQTKNNLYIRY